MNDLCEMNYDSTMHNVISWNSIGSPGAHGFEEVVGVNWILSLNYDSDLSAQLNYFYLISDQPSVSYF